MDKTHRKFALRGLFCGIVLLTAGTIYLIASSIFIIAHNFDGKCGGWPFLSGGRDCSLIDAIIQNMVLILPTAAVVYSPFILVFLLLTASVGYGMGRFKTRKIRSKNEVPAEASKSDSD